MRYCSHLRYYPYLYLPMIVDVKSTSYDHSVSCTSKMVEMSPDFPTSIALHSQLEVISWRPQLRRSKNSRLTKPFVVLSGRSQTHVA